MKNVINAFGLQCLPNSLVSRLFKKPFIKKNLSNSELSAAVTQLSKFINQKSVASKETERADELPFKISFPKLEGSNIEEHFETIGNQQIASTLTALQPLLTLAPPTTFPEWNLSTPGWTRYSFNELKGIPVSSPKEASLVFDVEVCVSAGEFPILGTACSESSWYSWTSPCLFSENIKSSPETPLTVRDLIPFGKAPILLIGHNVSYDRARIAEEYSLEVSKRKFLDTMSLHIAVSGMTSEQRILKNTESSSFNSSLTPWMSKTCLNNLSDVYSYYCSGASLSKEPRSIFVKGSLSDVKENFQNLMSYCASDTLATLRIFQKLFPLFRTRCPHPVSLAGMLEFGSSILPTDESWFQYLKQSERVSKELSDEISQALENTAKEAVQLTHDDDYKDDPWLWTQNWTLKTLKVKKKCSSSSSSKAQENDDRTDPDAKKDLNTKFKSLICTRKDLYKAQPRIPGYPTWYQELSNRNTLKEWTHELIPLTPGKAIVPLLLRLTWKGCPLYRHETHKWGYISSSSNLKNDIDITELERRVQDLGGTSSTNLSLPLAFGLAFNPLVHKDGKSRVGNPLSQDFSDKIADGTLSTNFSSSLSKRVLNSSKTLSYWKSNSERISSQILVVNSEGQMSICPQITAAGTLTRRAVEKTWLTASNAKADRIGSELKALIKAPDGYNIIGADVDSQELWIASLLGDSSYLGIHGCTPLGMMVLSGNKENGSDVHSTTAKVLGITRNEAKILNYGRIYGAGISFAKKQIGYFNPLLSERELESLARTMFERTKGHRHYRLNSTGVSLLEHLKKNDKKYLYLDDDEYHELIDSYSLHSLILYKTLLDSHLIPINGDFEVKKTSLSLFSNKTRVTAQEAFDVLSPLMKFSSKSNYKRSKNKENLENYRRIRQSLIDSQIWIGGSESHTFNKLEEIACNEDKTVSPVLKCRISTALETKVVGSDFLRSRINWIVQTSGVDYLHLLLVCMKWITAQMNIETRFLISIHDEVRYLVPSKDRFHAAYALQISNLFVRSMFSSTLGMDTLPVNVAFFSGVDIDRVLRKDPTDDCVTPSNPLGLYQGYGIEFGETYGMESLMERLKDSKILENFDSSPSSLHK